MVEPGPPKAKSIVTPIPLTESATVPFATLTLLPRTTHAKESLLWKAEPLDVGLIVSALAAAPIRATAIEATITKFILCIRSPPNVIQNIN